jgi:hypothetical protein
MPTLWLTYAWKDNEEGDVDFIAQELGRAGIDVKLDRWNIRAGRRLWEQIEHFITDPGQSDSWMLYATQHSLGSEPCKEEYAYALDRALHTRGGEFPLIGLFPGPVDRDLIPAGIRTRLFVSTTDPDWKERIVAAIEGRDPQIARSVMEPYAIKLHEIPESEVGFRYAIEIRPRAGTWAPFIMAIPIGERDHVQPGMMYGPRGRLPDASAFLHPKEAPSLDGGWWCLGAQNEATPTQSYFLYCKELPSAIQFGIAGTTTNYTLKLVPTSDENSPSESADAPATPD